MRVLVLRCWCFEISRISDHRRSHAGNRKVGDYLSSGSGGAQGAPRMNSAIEHT